MGNESFVQLGSVVNQILSQVKVEPHEGMAATICGWSDRYPATVVRVTKSQIHVQEDNYKRIDNNGMSEDQEYEYTRNPSASIQIFRKTKNGWRNKSGSYLSLGRRNRYYDFSF